MAGQDIDLNNVNLTTWNVNQTRVIETVDNSLIQTSLPDGELISSLESSGSAGRGTLHIKLTSCMKEHILNHDIQSLDSLVKDRSLGVGDLFYDYADYYCNGLPAWQQAKQYGTSLPNDPKLHRQLTLTTRINLPFTPTNNTTHSSDQMLSHQGCFVVIGQVRNIDGQGNVTASPYVIASANEIKGPVSKSEQAQIMADIKDTTIREARKQLTQSEYEKWQERIEQIYQDEIIRGNNPTHSELCETLAAEIGINVESIKRQTNTPRPKKS
jgi:hypothetical protein